MITAEQIAYNWLFDFYKKDFEYLDYTKTRIIDMTCNAEIVQLAQDGVLGAFIDRIKAGTL